MLMAAPLHQNSIALMFSFSSLLIFDLQIYSIIILYQVSWDKEGMAKERSHLVTHITCWQCPANFGACGACACVCPPFTLEWIRASHLRGEVAALASMQSTIFWLVGARESWVGGQTAEILVECASESLARVLNLRIHNKVPGTG